MLKPKFEPIVLTKDLLDGWKRTDQVNHRAVVFVHGFMGKPADTWKAPSAAKSFPDLLRSDPKVSDFDVFRFEYKSNPFSGPNIKNIARQLETEIADSLGGYQIVLLAHSMGGLVCMQYIVRRLEKGDGLPVVGLLMFGSPTTGVEWVNIAKIVLALGGLKSAVFTGLQKLLTGNSQFEELSTASRFLQDLHGNWILRVVNGGYPTEPPNRRAWVPVRVVTGNEDWVVKEHSAKGVYGEIDWNPVQVDHQSLVKPGDHKHVCYRRAVDFLARCRSSPATDVLDNLRGLSDWVWGLRQTKLIRNWEIEVHFCKEGQQLPGSSLRLEGFSPCEVKCRYTLLLVEEPLVLGLTLGQDAAKKSWKANPAYLHQIYLAAMKAADREVVSKTIRTRLSEPEGVWEAFFENAAIKVAEAGSGVWYNLEKKRTEHAEDYLLAYFHLPEAAKPLAGKEVTLDIGFRSLRPNSVNDFTLQFPWLTAGFDALVVIHGKTDYLVTASQIFGHTKPTVLPPEDFGDGYKIRISGDKHLVLPGSAVRIEWLPK